MVWEILVQILLNGFFAGSIYGLMALGLMIIWGVLRIINLAHGALVILGAYAAFWLFRLYGLNPFYSLPLVLLIGFLLGLSIHYSLVKPVLKAPELSSLLVFFGLSLIIVNLMLIYWTANVRGLPILYPSYNVGSVTVIGDRLLASVTAIVATALLIVFLQFTHLGRSIRATVQDDEAASLMGVNVNRIYAITMGIGVLLTSLGGALIALTTPFTPYTSDIYALYAFAVVVIGGLGNPLGTLLGGIIIGEAENLTAAYYSPGMAPAVAFILLVLVLALRPRGLLSRRR
jgi:branched-chain amino acid transport system permease protein